VSASSADRGSPRDDVGLVLSQPVAGTEAQLDTTVRGNHGEVLLRGVATSADVETVVAAVRTVLDDSFGPDIVHSLAADHPAASLDPVPEAIADRLGLPQRRDLLQLRRPLPLPDALRRLHPAVEVRPLRLPGDRHLAALAAAPDVAPWLRVNNRAFAAHPDQGTETVASLFVRLDVEWDDPSGFLVADDADRTGEFAGFCWTKTHQATETDPALGEIYVIGVDPSHRGEGLGPPLVLAGLDHLARRGYTTANLYVDADNEPARRLYDRLGFGVHQRRRVYTAAAP
jgi:mycothiol synthase